MQVSPPRDEVVDDHDGDYGALEYGIAVEEVEKARGRGYDPPGYNGKGDDEAEELAADNVEVSWQQGRDVGGEGDEVAGDGRAEGGKGEARGSEEHAGSGRGGVPLVENSVEEIIGVPVCLAV